MTHITDELDHFGPTEPSPGWIGRIASWFLAKKQQRATKRAALHLLSFDDRKLQDIGLTRAELARELGVDPNWSRDKFRVEYFHLPHL